MDHHRLDGRKDEHGRYGRIIKTVKGTKREAERARAELVAQLAAGTYFRPSKEIVSAFLNRWLETQHNLRPGTRQRYGYVIGQHIQPVIGNLLLTELDAPALLKLDRSWRDAGLASGTIRLNYVGLHRALKMAVRWRLLPSNPADADRAAKGRPSAERCAR